MNLLDKLPDRLSIELRGSFGTLDDTEMQIYNKIRMAKSNIKGAPEILKDIDVLLLQYEIMNGRYGPYFERELEILNDIDRAECGYH